MESTLVEQGKVVPKNDHLAVLKFYPAGVDEPLLWTTVLPESTSRHSDGSFSFKYRTGPGEIPLRVTLRGDFFITYPADPQDNKL